MNRKFDLILATPEEIRLYREHQWGASCNEEVFYRLVQDDVWLSATSSGVYFRVDLAKVYDTYCNIPTWFRPGPWTDKLVAELKLRTQQSRFNEVFDCKPVRKDQPQPLPEPKPNLGEQLSLF